MMKYLIVGVDPGKTAAIACIDLHGKTVRVFSKRFAERSWFIDSIKSIGTPAVIASDKKQPNRLVTELASIFDAVLFAPGGDIAVQKKKEVTYDEDAVENLHERDALAAAKIAYFSYANKLNKAERNAREKDFGDVERLKALVLKHYSIREVMDGRTDVGRFVRS